MNCYQELHRRKLTTSLRHFSRHWLGAAQNYACVRGERGLSPKVLKTLSRRLWREGHPILAARVAWASIRAGAVR